MKKSNIVLNDGVVVWARLGNFPWWPSLIINREVHEANLDPADSLPPATKHNRMVEFFNDNKRVAVVDLPDLAEFTTNMRKLKGAGSDLKDVVIACEEAKHYIETMGLPEQQQLLQGNPIEEHWKPKKASKRDKARRQSTAHVSDDDPDPRPARPPAKGRGRGKTKRERPRSASPAKKRTVPDDRQLEELPRPKRTKNMSRRKSTGSALGKKSSEKPVHKPIDKPSRKPGPSKRDKIKPKLEHNQPISASEPDDIDDIRDDHSPATPGAAAARGTKREREMEIEPVKEEDEESAAVEHAAADAEKRPHDREHEDEDEEEEGKEGEEGEEDAAAMEIEPATAGAPPRTRIPSSRYVDQIAGTKEKDVRFIFKDPAPLTVNTILADSDNNVSVEIAQKVCETVVNGAAAYISDLMDVVRRRDELQKELDRLDSMRQALVDDIRALNAKKFPMDMLIESGIGKRLLTTMDELRPHSTEATNELVFVLRKWADQANKLDQADGNESGVEADHDTPVKEEPAAQDVAEEGEEGEVVERGECKTEKNAVKKEQDVERREEGEEEGKGRQDASPSRRKMTPSDPVRRLSKSPPSPKQRGDEDAEEIEPASERTGDRGADRGSRERGEQRAEETERRAKKSPKLEDAEGTLSRTARPANARQLDKVSPMKAGGKGTAKWEAFTKATALQVFRNSVSVYLRKYPTDDVEQEVLAEILEKAAAEKCGDDKKAYFDYCKKVVLFIKKSVGDSDESARVRSQMRQFVVSRQPTHILDAI